MIKKWMVKNLIAFFLLTVKKRPKFGLLDSNTSLSEQVIVETM